MSLRKSISNHLYQNFIYDIITCLETIGLGRKWSQSADTDTSNMRVLTWEECDTRLKYGTGAMQATALQKVETLETGKWKTLCGW